MEDQHHTNPSSVRVLRYHRAEPTPPVSSPQARCYLFELVSVLLRTFPALQSRLQNQEFEHSTRHLYKNMQRLPSYYLTASTDLNSRTTNLASINLLNI